MTGSTKVPRFLRRTSGRVGAALLLLVLAVAVIGPLLAPHAPGASLGLPGADPSGDWWFGLDALGRDVLSRALYGGRSVLLLGTATTAAAYLVGVTIGLVAGYSRTLVDPILMRSVDVLLTFPALLLLLLLIAGLGTGVGTLLLGVVVVQVPYTARLTYTATKEVSTRGFVRAAVVRGERAPSIMVREILPNIAPTVLASLGLGFGYSVLVIASVNYLGLGLSPGTADWGLMLSESQIIVDINPFAILVPAALLAMLMISVNLIADAYAQALDQS